MSSWIWEHWHNHHVNLTWQRSEGRKVINKLKTIDRHWAQRRVSDSCMHVITPRNHHELPTHAAAHCTSSGATYFPHEVFFSPSPSPRKHTRAPLLSPQCPRKATTQTAAAISGPSCRHVCSAAYLFKPAAGPGGPVQASPGASPACLRIHSHLRIKLLTLTLLVMLGPAPTFWTHKPAGAEKYWTCWWEKKVTDSDMIQGEFC